MAKCLAQTPPLYHTDTQRAAACFLYEQSAVLNGEDMDRVFRTNGRITGSPG
jgi:hypothetical protein